MSTHVNLVRTSPHITPLRIVKIRRAYLVVNAATKTKGHHPATFMFTSSRHHLPGTQSNSRIPDAPTASPMGSAFSCPSRQHLLGLIDRSDQLASVPTVIPLRSEAFGQTSSCTKTVSILDRPGLRIS
jgi:hypothetical protein